MGERDDWYWHRENMAGQGEGFVSRAQLAAEKASALVEYRKRAQDYAAKSDAKRAEYYTFLSDSLEFGYIEARRRRDLR